MVFKILFGIAAGDIKIFGFPITIVLEANSIRWCKDLEISFLCFPLCDENPAASASVEDKEFLVFLELKSYLASQNYVK